MVQTVTQVLVFFFVFEFPTFSLNCYSSLASQSGNQSAIVLKSEAIIFQLPLKLAVIFTCKYFKFGLNTTGLSQSHFITFSACSINQEKTYINTETCDEFALNIALNIAIIVK